MNRTTSSIWKTVAVWLVFLAASCGDGQLRPVAITAGDACDYCRMAISEKQYAGELLDLDGNTRKFDDLSCMLKYLKKSNPGVAAYFVMDYETRSWVKAEEASFVRSSQLKTPMSGGIIAFKDKTKAEEALRRHQGELITFKQLLNDTRTS